MNRIISIRIILLLFLGNIGAGNLLAQSSIPPFKKGERVIFVGNSITHGGHYHSFVWLYYMTRFPDKPITVMNAGIGGESAWDIKDRLDEDVFKRKPTYITLTFGMNDTGYDIYWKDNAKELSEQQVKKSLDNFKEIEEQLLAKDKVTKVLIGGSPYDETTQISSFLFKNKNDAILKIIDAQRSTAAKNGWGFVDFNQPMVTQAPCVVTVCADVHRFSMWCEQRDADPAYDNFAWFLNASTDALLAAQNLCVEAEMNGLGICYLGTTIYTAGMIAEILELPKGVIPVTTIVLGYPDESPELTDRLPLEAVVHYEKYTDYTAAEIDELWAEREESELTKRLLEENGLPNLAQIFTQRRYVREDNLSISNSYFALLKEKGFFNN